MRRFIGLLLILVLSIWLGLQIAKDPGLAFFSYRQWSVEMPLWFALLSLIVILFLFHLIESLLSRVSHFSSRWNSWLRWRRKNQACSKTNRGLIELIEEHWKSAENYLTAGIDQSELPLVSYLALAKAAHEQAAYDKRDGYLCKAHTVSPHAEMAIGLIQAQFQIDQGQLEQALATLNHLRTMEPQHPLVLKLLERIYIHLADWHSLLKLLPNLRRANIVTGKQLALLEQKTYAELLKSTISHPEGLASLRAIWHNMPRRLQKEPQLLGCYAQQLLHYPDETTEAVEFLGKSLKKSWDVELVKLYGLLNASDSVKQLARAEHWLASYPEEAPLFLTLGRLSVRCQLWGKARSYFEESLKREENPLTYFEYGKLLEQMGDFLAAMQAYRQGLGLL